MIIAVEGPSAAGKTHWLRRLAADNTVWEAEVLPDAPDRAVDPDAAERYWAERNAERWALAVQYEEEHDFVFCDTDPLKLHYVWSLCRINAASAANWARAVEVHRELLQHREVGFTDLVIVSIPDEVTLRQRKESDMTRRRRNFEKHVRLSEHLRSWYEILNSIEPGKVLWGFPEDVTSARAASKDAGYLSRYSRELFEELVQKATGLVV